MKLATFQIRRPGEDRPSCTSGDARLFDLAAAADRDGRANPAFASMLALIDAGPARARTGQPTLFDKTARMRACRSRCRRRRNPGADPGAAADARRHVVPAAHPAGAARPAQACRTRQKRHGGTGAARCRTARRIARGLSQAADLLHHQPLQRPRHQHHGEMAALQPGDGLRTASSASSPRTRVPTFPRPKPRITSSAIRSSTISRRATPSASRWKAGSAPPKARVSTAAT